MRRPRRNHTAAFKAKVAIAALKGDETLAHCLAMFQPFHAGGIEGPFQPSWSGFLPHSASANSSSRLLAGAFDMFFKASFAASLPKR